MRRPRPVEVVTLRHLPGAGPWTMTLGTGASMENKKTVESTDATPSMVADRAATAEDAATMIRT